MIGLYAIGIIALWIGITWLVWKWGRWFAYADSEYRAIRIALVAVVAVVWMGLSFWYGGGRKIYYDAQVRELCAKDGGVTVYEQVWLPVEKFDKWGNIHIPAKDKVKTDDQYYFERTTKYLRKGNPELWRSRHIVARKSDGKVMGEAIRYARRGGDLSGPWHSTSYSCPESDSEPSLYKSIFNKEVVK